MRANWSFTTERTSGRSSMRSANVEPVGSATRIVSPSSATAVELSRSEPRDGAACMTLSTTERHAR